MIIDTIMVDFAMLERVKDGAEFKFYQIATPIAIALYFPKFYIDKDNMPIPVRDDSFPGLPLIPDTAIIIIN